MCNHLQNNPPTPPLTPAVPRSLSLMRDPALLIPPGGVLVRGIPVDPHVCTLRPPSPLLQHEDPISTPLDKLDDVQSSSERTRIHRPALCAVH